MDGSILIVDDEPKIGSMLSRALQGVGLEAMSTADPERGLALLRERPFDVVVTDLLMPGIDGLEFLRRAKTIRPSCEIVMMTAHASVETAREALKRGAVDYITKPVSIERDLKPLLSGVLGAPGPPDEGVEGHPGGAQEAVADSLARDAGVSGEAVVANSPRMRALLARVRKVARSDASVLLCGESGTGKEVIANLIHAQSSRFARPLVKVNCAALPESLLESELFGYTKGAFTGADTDREGLFEAADGGTLLLDEIGEISPTFQPKLLRVLQDGEFHRIGQARKTVRVDVRVIASTNRNMEEAVASGAFRRDLYYRLNVVTLVVPPLREHMEDLADLLDHFVRRLAKNRNVVFSREALQTMQHYSWPGNVRELANAIECALALGGGGELGVEDLPVALQDHRRLCGQHPRDGRPDVGTLEEIEMRCILHAMLKTQFNRTRASQLLGVTRRTLGYRIRKYGLEQELDLLRRGELEVPPLG